MYNCTSFRLGTNAHVPAQSLAQKGTVWIWFYPGTTFEFSHLNLSMHYHRKLGVPCAANSSAGHLRWQSKILVSFVFTEGVWCTNVSLLLATDLQLN